MLHVTSEIRLGYARCRKYRRNSSDMLHVVLILLMNATKHVLEFAAPLDPDLQSHLTLWKAW